MEEIRVYALLIPPNDKDILIQEILTIYTTVKAILYIWVAHFLQKSPFLNKGCRDVIAQTKLRHRLKNCIMMIKNNGEI
jgi:hypothetical protein